MHLQSHCNRWKFQSAPSAFQMWWAQTTSVTCTDKCIKTLKLDIFIPGFAFWCAVSLLKSQKCSTVHWNISLSHSCFQLQPFFSAMNACRCIWAGNHSARGHPCWNCVGSDLIFHKFIHHPRKGQQSRSRVPCTVEKYCTAVTTLVRKQSSVWLIFINLFFMEKTAVMGLCWKIHNRLDVSLKAGQCT